MNEYTLIEQGYNNLGQLNFESSGYAVADMIGACEQKGHERKTYPDIEEYHGGPTYNLTWCPKCKFFYTRRTG